MALKLIKLLAVLLLFSTAVYGRDLWDPPWNSSLPDQTYQAWEFPMYTPGIPFQPIPTIDQNPFGTAEITEIPPFTFPDWVLGPEGTGEIATLHINVNGPFTIWVPNNPNPNDVKLIFWQITSDKSPTPTGSGPTVTTPEGYGGTNLPSPYPQIQWPNGTWYTYNGLIQIRPNPAGEWITWDLVESTNIEEIVIKTICMPIPEPMTIGIAGIVMALLMLRKRS